jgi:hypothetical protein
MSHCNTSRRSRWTDDHEHIESGRASDIGEGIAADTADARQLRRARALLWLDDEEGAEEISQRLGVSRRTIYN